MFEEYQSRRDHGNGNGQSAGPVSGLGTGEKAPPIVRKEGAENSAAFWNLFVSAADQERAVEKSTAIYVAKTIVDEAIGGGRGNQAIVAFKNDPVTISDVLATIDRLCGAARPAGSICSAKPGSRNQESSGDQTSIATFLGFFQSSVEIFIFLNDMID
jgi:hypothetical protein